MEPIKTPEPVKRVYLLGAGFSKAVWPAMPLMKELSKAMEEVAPKLKESPYWSRLIGDEFENGLSFLSADAAWMNTPENLRKKAFFHEVIQVLQYTLQQRVDDTDIRLGWDCSDGHWIFDLVNHWIRAQAEVISFNYDTLIESVVARRNQRTPREEYIDTAALYPIEIPNVSAKYAAVFARDKMPNRLTLSKLHGSINWLHDPNSNNPDKELFHLPVLPPLEGPLSKTTPCDARYQRHFAPFIIPPLTTKAEHYGVSYIKWTWMHAANVLREARELVLIGYSLPPTDWLAAQFLKELQVDVKITVVDKSPGPIAGRLRKIFGDPNKEICEDFSGKSAIEDYVRHLFGGTPSKQKIAATEGNNVEGS